VRTLHWHVVQVVVGDTVLDNRVLSVEHGRVRWGVCVCVGGGVDQLYCYSGGGGVGVLTCSRHTGTAAERDDDDVVSGGKANLDTMVISAASTW
jgi:hypothetical protein